MCVRARSRVSQLLSSPINSYIAFCSTPREFLPAPPHDSQKLPDYRLSQQLGKRPFSPVVWQPEPPAESASLPIEMFTQESVF